MSNNLSVQSGPTPPNDVAIAVCTDLNMLAGAHVTLHSALSRLSIKEEVSVYVYHHGLTATNLELLAATVAAARPKSTFIARQVDLDRFSGMRAALGTPINYVVFYLAEEIDSRRIIYLDVDLSVKCDLADLLAVDLQGAAMGAVSWDDISHCAEATLFQELGLSPSAPYFNSGVLLIDSDRLRELKFRERAEKFARQFVNRLVGCDQPVLNYVLHGEIVSVPRRFNTILASHSPSPPASVMREERIWHFLGRPKPWEPFGAILNPHSRLFFDELAETRLKPKNLLGSLSWRKLRRIFRYQKDYYRCFVDWLRRSATSDVEN